MQRNAEVGFFTKPSLISKRYEKYFSEFFAKPNFEAGGKEEERSPWKRDVCTVSAALNSGRWSTGVEKCFPVSKTSQARAGPGDQRCASAAAMCSCIFHAGRQTRSEEAVCASLAHTTPSIRSSPLMSDSRHMPIPLVRVPNDPTSAHRAPR